MARFAVTADTVLGSGMIKSIAGGVIHTVI